MKAQNQRMIVSYIRALWEMDSRGILVPADSAMFSYGMRGFTAPASTQVKHF